MDPSHQGKNLAIRIVQWNAQSLKPKLACFGELLNRERIHIALISESWLSPQACVRIRDYNIFRQDRYDTYGGVAIITHKSIQCSPSIVNLNNLGIEALHLRLFNCGYLENIISIYCPSSVHTQQSDWEQLFSHCTSKTLIAGDFNGHHNNWSYKTDIRGTQLVDSALEYGFTALNDGASTRIKLVNGNLQQSSPDVTFISADVAVRFDWQVLNENLGSDHLIIKINLASTSFCKSTEIRNYKKANWNVYDEIINKAFTDDNLLTLNDNVEEMYNFLIDQIKLAVEASIPLIKFNRNPKSNFKPRAFWNSSLSLVVAQRRLALSVFRRNPTPLNLDKLEQKISEAKKAIRKAKAISWQEFVSSIDQETSALQMWKRMRWMKGIRENRPFAPFLEQNLLLRSLTPDYATNCAPTFTSKNELLESMFTIDELQNCLKKKDSAPGIDGISYSMISRLPENAKLP